MSHLSTDRLAAIADDTPTADEATHLAGCWDCRAEVAAYRRLARMSAMAPLPTEPLTAWSQLAPRLRDEGLIADRAPTAIQTNAPMGAELRLIPATRTIREQGVRVPRWALRSAAALLLLAGGAALGRFSSGLSFGGPDGTDLAGAIPVGSSPQFISSADAMQTLASSQQQYQQAAAFLAAQDTGAHFIGMNQAAYEVRLSALDDIAAATRAALYRTPQDPMLNQYYLTTLGAREATLRQIGATQPATRRMERY